LERDRSTDPFAGGFRDIERNRATDPFARFSERQLALMSGAAGRHGSLADMFGPGGGLSRFRDDAIGSGLFNDRVDYLRAAQGRGDTGAKGTQFDDVVARDIAALKDQQKGASAADQAKLQTMIDILAAIRDKETFPTENLPTKAEWASQLGSLRASMEGTKQAVQTLKIPTPMVSVNVMTNVSVRAYEVQRTVISRAGRAYAV